MNIGFALVTKDPFFGGIIDIENEVHTMCRFRNRLGLKENIPHTTIFQGTFEDTTDYSAIVRNIREYFRCNCDDYNLHFEKVVYVPQGWYFYTCRKTEELQNLHLHTLGLCKEHIVLSPNRLNRNLNDLTESQKIGIEKYGYRYAEKAFFPHITIGRNDGECREQMINDLNQRLSKLPSEVPIDRITVYRMGENGVHAETLDEVYL